MTELQQFRAMLERAGVGYSLQCDDEPPGETVLVESGGNETELIVTEFAFDAEGRLKEVVAYEVV